MNRRILGCGLSAPVAGLNIEAKQLRAVIAAFADVGDPIDLITRNVGPATKMEIEKRLYSRIGKFKFEEAYWLYHAEKIKEIIGKVPLMLMGGMKYPQTMEKILEEKKADLISLCRALIREPDFPNEMANGRKDTAKFAFCNRCFMEVQKNL